MIANLPLAGDALLLAWKHLSFPLTVQIVTQRVA